jgi:hypothetical protein
MLKVIDVNEHAMMGDQRESRVSQSDVKLKCGQELRNINPFGVSDQIEGLVKTINTSQTTSK